MVDPISRKYFRTKLYEEEKKEKEQTITELHHVKKLYELVIDENKELKEQIRLLNKDINLYKGDILNLDTKLKNVEQENTKIKSSFWYKIFGKKK